MKNFIQDGDVLTLTAPSAVVSGTPYLFGGLLVVAQADAAEDEQFAAATEGVFELAKKTTDVMTAGAQIYWDNGNSEFTTDDSGNYSVGTCVEDAGNGAETVKVKLFGYAVLVNP